MMGEWTNIRDLKYTTVILFLSIANFLIYFCVYSNTVVQDEKLIYLVFVVDIWELFRWKYLWFIKSLIYL